MTTNSTTNPRRSLWRWVVAGAAVLGLVLVFAAWLQPEMTMQMAQQLWSCF